MPTYEYFCTKCEQDFEIFQSMNDKALTICPKELCRLKQWGKGKVKKKIGAGAGLIFKGSGFYITDYRSDSYKEAAKKDSGSGAAAGGEKKSGDGAAKESKPATPKTEKKSTPAKD
jgi:putative FmdB family regulatory protein